MPMDSDHESADAARFTSGPPPEPPPRTGSSEPLQGSPAAPPGGEEASGAAEPDVSFVNHVLAASASVGIEQGETFQTLTRELVPTLGDAAIVRLLSQDGRWL